MSDFAKGCGYFVRGFGLIGRHRVRRWAVIPMMIAALLLAGLTWLAYRQLDPVVASVRDAVPSWLEWLQWVLWVLFGLAAIFFITFTYVIAASIVASPFNGLLAEATEVHLTGRPPPSMPVLRMLKRLPAILWQETKKVLYALLLAVPFLVLFFIPVVNIAAPFLWFAYNAWITTFAFADYVLDNNGLQLADMRRVLGSRRMLTLGFGTLAFCALSVPILNVFALPAAVAGATAMWVGELAPATAAGSRR